MDQARSNKIDHIKNAIDSLKIKRSDITSGSHTDDKGKSHKISNTEREDVIRNAAALTGNKVREANGLFGIGKKWRESRNASNARKIAELQDQKNKLDKYMRGSGATIEKQKQLDKLNKEIANLNSKIENRNTKHTTTLVKKNKKLLTTIENRAADTIKNPNKKDLDTLGNDQTAEALRALNRRSRKMNKTGGLTHEQKLELKRQKAEEQKAREEANAAKAAEGKKAHEERVRNGETIPDSQRPRQLATPENAKRRKEGAANVKNADKRNKDRVAAHNATINAVDQNLVKQHMAELTKAYDDAVRKGDKYEIDKARKELKEFRSKYSKRVTRKDQEANRQNNIKKAEEAQKRYEKEMAKDAKESEAADNQPKPKARQEKSEESVKPADNNNGNTSNTDEKTQNKPAARGRKKKNKKSSKKKSKNKKNNPKNADKSNNGNSDANPVTEGAFAAFDMSDAVNIDDAIYAFGSAI